MDRDITHMYVYWLTEFGFSCSFFCGRGMAMAQRRTFGSEAYSKDETEQHDTRKKSQKKNKKKCMQKEEKCMGRV